MAAREFDSRATDTTEDPEPTSFTLSDLSDRDFRCVRMIPPAVVGIFTDLPPLPAPDDPRFDAFQILYVARFMQFIRACVVPEDEQAWDDLTATAKIAPGCYAEIATWLALEYARKAREAREAIPAPDPTIDDELDEITRRQMELNALAHGTPMPDTLPPELQAILNAGGGFTL